jgi:hypothetical protein
MQVMSIRRAIRQVLRTAFIAKETRNREAYLDCRAWIHRYWHERNSGKSVFFSIRDIENIRA